MSEPRPTTKKGLDAVGRERARLDDAIRWLGADASTTRVTPDGWTAKDVLGHPIHWTSQFALGLGAKLEPPGCVANAQDRPSGDAEWNARASAHHRDWPCEQIRERSDDQMNATDQIPWAGARPLWQQIASETYEHWPRHAADIVAAASGVL
jgi:hypothetical protein